VLLFLLMTSIGLRKFNFDFLFVQSKESVNKPADEWKKNAIEVETTKKQWHLAVTGTDFANIRKYFPEWIQVFAAKGTIFARMSPDQKTGLIESLEEIDYHSCMCGDGANDCGALKRAPVGVSLSEYEASIAAPFTAHPSLGIQCVPMLIREGRAALVTSFGMFKFMALYSLIQFVTITIVYYYLSSLSDVGFMYIDLVIIDLIAFTMSRNYPYKDLHSSPPLRSLISKPMLTSLIFNVILQTGVQVASDYYLMSRCWYNSLPVGKVNQTVFNNLSSCTFNVSFIDQSQVEDEYEYMSYNSANLLLLSVFLYLNVSITFSQSHPYRTRIFKNKPFLFVLLILYALNVFILFFAPIELLNFMQVRDLPTMDVKFAIIIFSALHFFASILFEMMVIEKYHFWRLLDKACGKELKKKYQRLLQQLENEKEQICSFNPKSCINKKIHSDVFNLEIYHSNTSVECESTKFSSKM